MGFDLNWPALSSFDQNGPVLDRGSAKERNLNGFGFRAKFKFYSTEPVCYVRE